MKKCCMNKGLIREKFKNSDEDLNESQRTLMRERENADTEAAEAQPTPEQILQDMNEMSVTNRIQPEAERVEAFEMENYDDDSFDTIFEFDKEMTLRNARSTPVQVHEVSSTNNSEDEESGDAPTIVVHPLA